MTRIILIPDGTTASSGALIVNAATAHQALSDDNDSTFVRVNLPSDFVRVDLAASNMPDGAVSRLLGLRFRWAGPGSGFGGNARLSIRRGDGSVLSQWEHMLGNSLTPTTIVEPWIQFSGSEAEVDALKLQVEALSHPDLRAVELHLELVYVIVPTVAVTAVTPDPYTATNRVPLSWSPGLDVDGGPQTHYQARVFTAAQYGAGGFDPATSAATWDSGVVSSGNTNLVTDGLPNTTLRAYIRVAQTVNGQQHWSAYAFDQFAVSVATSDVASVAFAANDSAATNTITVTRNAATVAWTRVEIERSDDSGATWVPVRHATIVSSTGHATIFAATDPEAPNGGTIRYRARAYFQLSGVWVVGPWTESSSGSSWAQNRCVVRDPDSATQIEGVDWARFWNGANLAQQYPVTQGVFEPLDADISIVVQGTRQMPGRGTITLRTLNAAEATALERLIRQPVLLVLAPAGWGWGIAYIAPGTIDRQRGPKVTNLVSTWPIPFVASTRPSDPTAGEI